MLVRRTLASPLLSILARRLSILALLAIFASGGACGPPRPPTKKQINAKKARLKAESIKYTVNWEQDNIVRRQRMVGQAGLTGFITLYNAMGMPIIYTDVSGKVTSGGKRITQTWEIGAGTQYKVVPAPSNDGTHGHSSPYIYFWDTRGKYYQWNSVYLFTDQPQELRVDPLIINIRPADPEQPVDPSQKKPGPK